MPFMGDSAERSWLEAMTHFIAKTASKIHIPGFAGYPANRLLIYDNRQQAAALGEPAAAERPGRELSDSGWNNSFDGIFVQRPRPTWEFNDRRPGFIKHAIPKAWF